MNYKGTCLSLHLKTRFWGQSDKRFNNVGVTTEMFFVTGSYVLYVEKNLATKFNLYKENTFEMK